MSEHTFEDIYKSVQNLEAGSFVTFNGFPMVVETQTTTYNRYYGELRWVNQLDGKLQIDVTVRVGINLDSEVTRLKAEVETIRKDRDLMFQEIKEGREAYQRLHHLYLTAKEGKQS